MWDAAKERLQALNRAHTAGRSGGRRAHAVRTGRTAQVRGFLRQCVGRVQHAPGLEAWRPNPGSRRCRGCVPAFQPTFRRRPPRIGDQRRHHRIGSGRRLGLGTTTRMRAPGSSGAGGPPAEAGAQAAPAEAGTAGRCGTSGRGAPGAGGARSIRRAMMAAEDQGQESAISL